MLARHWSSDRDRKSKGFPGAFVLCLAPPLRKDRGSHARGHLTTLFSPLPALLSGDAAVETYVLSDDAQFTKGGFMHRNRILIQGEPKWFIVPLQRASHKLAIAERKIAAGPWATSLLSSLRASYRRAPCFDEVYPLVEEILRDHGENFADLLVRSSTLVARHLGIEARFLRGVDLRVSDELRGAAHVIEECRMLGATEYLNREEGRHLYDAADFAAHGIRLRFFRAALREYPQPASPFVPGLSVLDFLMRVRPEDRAEYLDAFEVVD